MIKCWCQNRDFDKYSEGYYYCKKCGSLVSSSECKVNVCNVDDNSDFYGKDYWEKLMLSRAHLSDCSDMIDMYLKERAGYWLETLLRYLLPRGQKVLEIGCGLGQFSYLLKCAGYDETAYELSPSICEYVKRELGINVINSAFSNDGNKYSAITAMDLVEHLEDPDAVLEDVSECICDDGVILIQTPCFDEKISYGDLIQNKSRFLNLMSPNEHLFLFSRKSIASLLEMHGFKYIKFENAYFGNDYDMFVVASKCPLVEYSDKQIKEVLYKNPYGRLLYALISSDKENKSVREELTAVQQNRDGLLEQLKASVETNRMLEENRDGLLEQLKTSAKASSLLTKIFKSKKRR